MKHIFIVDDEKNIRDLIKRYIENEGYNVTMFENSLGVIEAVERNKPDLIVLDIMMYGMDGFELCKEIRKISDVPIIFVSARDSDFDKIQGLEIGGDDYLSKPFSPRELIARIRNIFKRVDKFDNKEDIITIKDITISKDRRTIFKEDSEIKLTTKEYELFEFLADNKNMPFNRLQLLDNIWGYDYEADERVVDDLVKRIRKKLKEEGSKLNITTVWGYGYKIEG